jgi:membrane-bound lytic murein transglycosylase B
VLAGIGKVESSHGTSSLPGVHSGVNAFGCCAGPMQFNLRNGPPSTWQRYGVDADHDGIANPYDIDDAAAAAARLLCASGAGLPQGVRAAVFAYNHDWSYVAQVLAHARRYQARGGGRR